VVEHEVGSLKSLPSLEASADSVARGLLRGSALAAR
jgi:hypothetical protein